MITDSFSATPPAPLGFDLSQWLESLGPEFDFWPFSMGMNESLLFSVSRIAFMLLIFAAIFGLLRFLYGPKGIWRDHELDEMAAAETARELAELEALFQRGEMDEDIYNMEKKRLSR